MRNRRTTRSRRRGIMTAVASSAGALALVSMVAAAPEASAYSRGTPGGMNWTERKWCALPTRWPICHQAKVASDEAKSWTHRLFGGHADGTKSNAFLHSYWHARMTQRMGHKVATAKEFGERHEANSSGNEKAMDLHNNHRGAWAGKGRTAAQARWILKSKADRAFLWGGWPNPAPFYSLWYLQK